MNQVPSAYTDGYSKARLRNQSLADNYVRHTTVGDPELDPVMAELSSLRPHELHQFIAAGIEDNTEGLRKAPQALRDFFGSLEEPSWLDFDDFRPGIRAFYANANLMLVAFVTGVLVEGFSTLIAKSFNITGRVAATKRRLQQNNRHMMDIFFPGGLQRHGAGWKLSTRIRFVHTRIRSLLAKSPDWNREAWGTPVSAAHLGYAISVFSKRLVDYSLLVGAKLSKEEQESIIQVWRYTGYLMGIPETILYTTPKEAVSVYNIGFMCEPPPDEDSISVANLLITAIPAVAGIADPALKKKLTRLAYRLSRALLGNSLADDFQFPKTFEIIDPLWAYRMKQRFRRSLSNKQLYRFGNFSQLLQISVYDDDGMSYKMPDHVYTSESIQW